MSAEDLIGLLREYQQTYPNESPTVERYVRFLNTYTDCFERTQLAGHVTGSAWLVNNLGTHVLLTHHKKLNRWLQLGGHADGHTNALEVAMKEAREESGNGHIKALSPSIFDVDIHEIPARHDEPAHFHYDARFAFQVDGPDEVTVSDESHALAWIEISELASFTDEVSMVRMADKWLASKE